ncbi:MAG: L-serine ammonia-lyase, partial [Rhodospirillales bacterium]|nr:L-serine ammonia-lyase [Rhodospirillales bacterium]
MTVSVFDIFKIGIGPSSSHTVGPMTAARAFVQDLASSEKATAVRRVTAELFGPLALTGSGHGTHSAIILGLTGARADRIDPDLALKIVGKIRSSGRLQLAAGPDIAFSEPSDLILHGGETLPHHVNGMRFTAFAEEGAVIHSGDFYSVGGGFIAAADDFAREDPEEPQKNVPFPFDSAAELLDMGERAKLGIWEIALANEKALRPGTDVQDQVIGIWRVMEACFQRGISAEGELPGPLSVPRRARAFYDSLTRTEEPGANLPVEPLDWVNLYAIAVNEENAAGGRIVTAPTNGAAGVIPAVISYYCRYCDGDEDGIAVFLLTAGAIGGLYKENASISGAEMGCQGEVGVACSMAAAGLTAVLGGTNAQIENAAEIGMEHNLGLTCDPVGGLVQIPCIERNAMGAVKAINAAKIALRGDGRHV